MATCYYRYLGEKAMNAVRELTQRGDVDSRLHEAGRELFSLSVDDEQERSANWKLTGKLSDLSQELNERYQDVKLILCDKSKPGSEGHIMNSIRAMDDMDKSSVIGDIMTIYAKVEIFNYLSLNKLV